MRPSGHSVHVRNSSAAPRKTGSTVRPGPWGRWAVAASALVAGTVMAQPSLSSPSSVFGQLGTVRSTRSASVGATWDWSPSWSFGPGHLGGYWEASAALWSYRAIEGDRKELAQLSAKPVFRYSFDGAASPWFVEAGVGLTLTSRVYHTERKQFSTAFNFGDHLAVGRSFGEGGNQELALRVEHFSNGSIKQPNPGETFLQLRYAYRFR